MKAAILSETPADQAAVVILAGAILRRRIEPVSLPFQPSGWSSVIKALPAQMKHLHYQSEVEAVIVMLDADDTPVHRPNHQAVPQETCRVCQVMKIWNQTSVSLTPLPNRTTLRIALAVPVPALEAWLQYGKDPHAEEAPFIRQVEAGKRLGNERRALKHAVYGTVKPSLTRETEIMTREATRLIDKIEQLRIRFPIGFGSFYETLASWR